MCPQQQAQGFGLAGRDSPADVRRPNLTALDVTAGLLVCSIATGIGVVLYAWTDVTAVAAVSPVPSKPASVAADTGSAAA